MILSFTFLYFYYVVVAVLLCLHRFANLLLLHLFKVINATTKPGFSQGNQGMSAAWAPVLSLEEINQRMRESENGGFDLDVCKKIDPK